MKPLPTGPEQTERTDRKGETAEITDDMEVGENSVLSEDGQAKPEALWRSSHHVPALPPQAHGGPKASDHLGVGWRWLCSHKVFLGTDINIFHHLLPLPGEPEDGL